MQTFLQFIRSCPLGGASPRNDWRNNDFLGTPAKTYSPHAVICREGDDDDRIFFVKSGWGLLYRGLQNAERQILDTPLRGDLVGFRSVDGPRLVTLTALTEMSVYEVPRNDLVAAMMLDGTLANKIACNLARRKAILSEHLVSAGRRNAITRTAHFLLELEARLSAVGLAAHGRYECPLIQNELADILGMSTVHVSRTLSELRKDKLLSFKTGHVQVINGKRLVEMTGFDKEYLRYT